MNEMIKDEIEKKHAALAGLKVLQKEIKERIEYLEGGLKHELLESFDAGKADRIPLIVGGYKVGNASVTAPNLKPRIVAGSEDEALKHLQELGLAEMKLVPVDGWEKHFVNVKGEAMHQDSGEIVDGIEFGFDRAPYVRVTVKPAETMKAFQAMNISTNDILRLADGNDE